MSNFRTFVFASFAVLALGTAAHAQNSGGGGGGGPGGGGEPGSVMNPVASPISFVARPNNPNRVKRPGRGRAGAQILCTGGSSLMSPARCQWN
jgi:hypothetical protein